MEDRALDDNCSEKVEAAQDSPRLVHHLGEVRNGCVVVDGRIAEHDDGMLPQFVRDHHVLQIYLQWLWSKQNIFMERVR